MLFSSISKVMVSVLDKAPLQPELCFQTLLHALKSNMLIRSFHFFVSRQRNLKKFLVTVSRRRTTSYCIIKAHLNVTSDKFQNIEQLSGKIKYNTAQCSENNIKERGFFKHKLCVTLFNFSL